MGRALLALLLAAAAGCRGAAPPAERLNILLIVVDTLRADRLGAYGNRRGLTPFLDELAARGQVVRHARAQAPWTNPSVASILTSRYESQHGVVDYNSILPATELTLAEALKADGYVTGAFSANGLIAESLGFAQGFDHFEAHLLIKGEEPKYLRIPRRADRMAADALAWLDAGPGAGGAPIFLYVHLMEPHPPYAPPPAALERLRGSRPPIDLRWASEAMYVNTTTPIGPAELEKIEDAYDASVLGVDEALRGFFAALETRGFFAHALVVVTADHGEEFQEHGARGHGRALFDESIHVPLIVLAPGKAPLLVERLVSSIDIAPTILELAGLPVPSRFAGTSFAADLEPGIWERLRQALGWPAANASVGSAYSELLRAPGEESTAAALHERALVVDREKIIRWQDGAFRFYDLAIDPEEQAPNSVEDPARARLEAELAEARTRAEHDPSPPEKLGPDPQLREELKGLGYVE